MVEFRITIFAARRVLPPDLITPANASKPRIKLERTQAVPPPESCSMLTRSERKVGAGARSPLEQHAFRLRQRQNRIQRILHRVNEAGRALRLRIAGAANSIRRCAGSQCQFCASEFGSSRSQPTLNHTGELNATFCVSSRCTSSSWKIAASSGVAKISARHAPVPHRLRYSRDKLPHARFALRRPHLAMQILSGHDVGRRHRPVGRDLHVFLLKNRLSRASVIGAVRRSHCTSS